MPRLHEQVLEGGIRDRIGITIEMKQGSGVDREPGDVDREPSDVDREPGDVEREERELGTVRAHMGLSFAPRFGSSAIWPIRARL